VKSSFLGTDFFTRDVLDVARDLVGVELVWNGCSGIIVETGRMPWRKIPHATRRTGRARVSL
jgi:3-methyladenine DNA glycosylase Mpg